MPEKDMHVISGQCFCLFCFDSLRRSQHFFHLCGDGSSRVETVLSKDKCVLLKDTTQCRR